MALKGRKLTEEHKEKMKQAKFNKFGKGRCLFCDLEFNKYTSSVVTCGDKPCVLALHKKRYEQEKIDDPVRSQARRMVGSLRLINKTDIIEKMLKDAFGEPCRYCGSELDTKNVSLDHKDPRHHHKKIPLEEARILDRADNLQIICRPCNQLKSDMNNEQYSIFLDFCDDYPDVGKLIKKRLNFARGRWQHIQFKK